MILMMEIIILYGEVRKLLGCQGSRTENKINLND